MTTPTPTPEALAAPSWTVFGNLHCPDSQKWVGMFWEFFDSEADAEECYRRHCAVGDCPVKRPFHSNDGAHLGAVHQWRRNIDAAGVARLRAERDALLAACRAILSDWDSVDPEAQVPDEINDNDHWDAIRDAIALCEKTP